jgi:PASTA domain-containing protein/Big-like domain-containing protein
MRPRHHTTRTRARHRWARGAFLRLEVLAVLIVAGCLALLSISQRPERIHVELTGGGGGSLTLSNTKEGAAILSLPGMRPGDSVTDTVTLGNTGTLPGDLSLATSNLVDIPGPGGGVLSGKLDLRVRDVTNAGSPVTVYTGKIDALTPVALGTIAAGDSRVYEFRVDFPDVGSGAENAYQGSGLSVEFDWTAVNNDADVDPPETTITSAPGSLSSSADASFSFTADEAGSAFECSLDGGSFAGCSSPASYTGLADGSHTFAVRATDAAANTDPTPDTHSWTIDATAPSVSLTDPGTYLRGTVALDASADDGTGSGLASLTIQRSPAGGGAWTAIAANWNTTSVADGDYQLQALATDNAGNSAPSPIRNVTVDNTAPSVASSTPPDGAVVGSAGALTIVASESVSGIANAKIDGVNAPAPVIGGASVTYTSAFDDTPHTFSGDLTDLAGNTTPILVHFTVWALADADYPWVEANSFAGAATTLEAADSVSEVFVPAGAWSGAPAGDWLVIRIDPRPPASVSGGFQTAGDIYDVTAYWALDGSAVHTFAKALDINLGSAPANAVPATLQSGSWRVIKPVPSGQTLPAGWQDGYYKAGSDVHVLTKHLSSFALLKDIKAPSKPGSFSGAKSHGHLVLKWKAATDNSGIIRAYLVYAKGTLVKTLPGSRRSADMGAYRTSDARYFQVAARDAAGNVGPKTGALVIVPNVKKLTLSQAKARLTAHGLKSGSVRYAYSTSIASGRVISAGRSGLVAKGTAVSLKVSRGVFRSVFAPVPPATGSFPGTPYSPPLTSPTGSTGGSPTSGAPSPSGTESSPPPAADDTPDADGVRPQSFTPGADEPASGLRRVLGLMLLGGAFLAAGAVALRARRGRFARPAAIAGQEQLLFWDQRLAQAVAGSVRRLTGRL